jgi:glycosyltransferase involved in cell wall biosynthesis
MSEIRRLKVWFVCTGVGIYNRGFESFFRNAFDGLHPLLTEFGIDSKLFKGGGRSVPPHEHRIRCLARTGPGAKLVGHLIRRNAYTVEQLSFLPQLILRIRRDRPDVIFHSDSNMAMQLWRHRKQIGVPFSLLYSNGAPLDPPFTMVDHVQQIVPMYYDRAIAAGESPAMHSMVPYGFNVPPGPPTCDLQAKQAVRRQLGLPIDRPIVISVGWIAKSLKRMDYTVNEIARMPEPRPYLVMLGAMDEQTPPILELARASLGESNFTARSVPLEQVDRYYDAADVFVLSSLREGFGRVYIEAMIHGLPVIAHDGPVTRYVLDDQGRLADLSQPGGLSSALAEQLASADTAAAPANRRESVRRRFSWQVLAPAYAEMFKAAARSPVEM